ncbi:MAG: enoyl-CoA hydratase/isomerase family protein [Alphaproteobacteria bacterium]|nr:enoyl-CoA hydratase/isomerase family protein [Alphaproteobacteria bacterium]
MIQLDRHGDIAVVTLVHGKANALDIEFCESIAAHFESIEKSSARAVVLTGQGRMFSAGVDLLRLSEGGVDYVRAFLPALHRLYQAVFFHAKPVVAAINGHAIAGGCVLACCADRRIAARDGGRIGVTELLVGVPFPPLAFEVMRYATAPQYFSDGVLSGATFAAEQALTRGLVDEVAEPSALRDRAIAAAEQMAALSPRAFAMTKGQLRAPVAERVARAGGDTAATDIWTAPETLERMRDYVSRTLKKS